MAAAFCKAINDWIAAEWLSRDSRLRASIVVPLQAPDLAIEEIERRAGDHRFVSVLVLAQGAVIYRRGEFEMPGFRQVLEVNLISLMACATKFHPMLSATKGSLIIVSSTAAYHSTKGNPAYNASKTGAVGLTRTLALEGARHGITCNAIVPGVIGTEAFSFGNPAMNERMVQRTAMRRAGEPQDVANAIVFLCSDLASYITGVGLNVSGGIELFTF
jgi:3-oxoacyl-[acyl-carrier protein] reductase